MKVIFVFAAFLVSIGLVQGFGLPTFGLPALPARPIPITSIFPIKPLENPTLATLLKPLNISTGNLFSAPSANVQIAPSASKESSASSALNPTNNAASSPTTPAKQAPELSQLIKEAVAEIFAAKSSLMELYADTYNELKAKLLTLAMSTLAKLKELAEAAKPQLQAAKTEALEVGNQIIDAVKGKMQEILELVKENKAEIGAIQKRVEDGLKACLLQSEDSLEARLRCARQVGITGLKEMASIFREDFMEVNDEMKKEIGAILSSIPKDGALAKVLEQLRKLYILSKYIY